MRISDWSSDVCSSDLADRLLLRPAARPGNAGDRDRDVGIAVREHARRHRPGGCERYFAEGFEDFAADIELRLFGVPGIRSEEHTSELQSLMRISYAVFCLKTKKKIQDETRPAINKLTKENLR